MKHYKYVGDNMRTIVILSGETALGHEINGVFKVQVDRFEHPWSHGWHDTYREEWEEIE